MANRLSGEQSPYLLQHADNPVGWYPWGDEAFARARDEDKPIFLSIGYSTCHWCHVMAHESFESAAVADVLNRHFVPVKVDREERPDVDRVYMTFVQATAGSGGWPLSVWLTPTLEPFYGGTYYPPTPRWGRPGFVDVLTEVARAWREERAQVVASAASILAHLHGARRGQGGREVPGPAATSASVNRFMVAFDSDRGGFGDAPKFPRPGEALFLLREHARTGHPEAREMALVTLRAMALGGMRDHIGGGFHRYSVDAAWRVPHFEKMLYDQAQLALAYTEAAQLTGEAQYADVARDTLAYVARDLTDPAGGFHSAEDADSLPPGDPAGQVHGHPREGAFYVWSEAEVREVLGADADIVCLRYGVRPEGNAPFDPQGEFSGQNLLYVAHSLDEVARATGRDEPDVESVLARSRERLWARRATRPRPHLDDKVLTAWNGLMIAARARAART
ncbi:MAG: thioredoxin domain-containing protein, partial [Acidobacteria bacterium]|nr:thioredoxin domain-containing protein [Acidobacteriota bacterium]